MYHSPRPLYAIPHDYPGVMELFQDTQQHVGYDNGTLHIYATNIDPFTEITDKGAQEAGYYYLADFVPEYTPTAEEVMRALRGPQGPPGPMGPRGDTSPPQRPVYPNDPYQL